MKRTKTTNPSSAGWRTSSYSNGTGGDCVEIASAPQDILRVRDSKDPQGAVLLIAAHAWTPFIATLKEQ